MTRSLVELSVLTHIPLSELETYDAEIIATYVDVIHEYNKA